MAEALAVTAISSTEATQSSPSALSLADYQRWLMSSGHIPLAQALPHHPSNVAATASGQATNLSQQWNSMLSSTDQLLSAGSLDSIVRSLRKEAFPGDARASMTGGVMDSPSAHEGEVEASKGEGNTLEQTAERAAAAIREATAETVDQQWRQTVALLDHQLSRQILTSSIETSISASKEMNDGLDSLLRG